MNAPSDAPVRPGNLSSSNLRKRLRWRSASRAVVVIDLRDDQVALTPFATGRRSRSLGETTLHVLPENLFAAPGEEAGQWLRDQLSGRTLRAESAIVLVPRSWCAVRTLTAPRVPQAELISLVGIQAETQSLTPASDLCWTFVCDHGSDSEEALRPQLITSSRRRLEPVIRMVASAGLQLEALLPRPVAMAASVGQAIQPPTPVPAPVWIIVQSGHELEMALASDRGELWASQSVRRPLNGGSPAADDRIAKAWGAAVAARMNASLADLADSVVENARLCCRLEVDADVAPALTEALISDAGFNPGAFLHSMRSSASSEGSLERARVAANGCLALLGSGRDVPDLWRAPQATVRRQRRWIPAAGLAAALVAIGAYSLGSAGSRLDRQLHALKESERQLSSLIDRGDAIHSLAGQLELWNTTRVPVREELAEFLSRASDDDELRLEEVSLSAESGGRVQLRALGGASSAEAAMRLNERLLAAPSRYRLQPHALKKARRGSEFSTAFEIESEIIETDPVEPPEAAATDDIAAMRPAFDADPGVP